MHAKKKSWHTQTHIQDTCLMLVFGNWLVWVPPYSFRISQYKIQHWRVSTTNFAVCTNIWKAYKGRSYRRLTAVGPMLWRKLRMRYLLLGKSYKHHCLQEVKWHVMYLWASLDVKRQHDLKCDIVINLMSQCLYAHLRPVLSNGAAKTFKWSPEYATNLWLVYNRA